MTRDEFILDRLQLIESGLMAGLTPDGVAADVGITRRSIARWLYNHGHTELASKFDERPRS